AWRDDLDLPVDDHHRHLRGLPVRHRLQLHRRLALDAGHHRAARRAVPDRRARAAGKSALAGAAPTRHRSRCGAAETARRCRGRANRGCGDPGTTAHAAAGLAAVPGKPQFPPLGGTGHCAASGATTHRHNVVMYYAPRIFADMGYATSMQMWFTAIVGLTNVLATFIAIGLVDRIGRKPI